MEGSYNLHEGGGSHSDFLDRLMSNPTKMSFLSYFETTKEPFLMDTTRISEPPSSLITPFLLILMLMENHR